MDKERTMSNETFQFKTEAKQLLDLMIHSIYSTKEIFLRELISNASDALDKLRFETLTHPELKEGDEPLRIRLSQNKDARTLTIDDNGIGMSRQEAIENLGTIAHSGTKEFLQKLTEAKAEGKPDALIGQFGVGFYSCFMAADDITVITRRAGETAATRWHSKGNGEFDIEDATRETQGTTITLHLLPADSENGLEDFTEEWVVRRTVKKYSDFVTYPIELFVVRKEMPRDEEGKEIEGAEEKVTEKWETLNSMKAIWTRAQSEVTKEEYAEFYKHIAHDWEPPFDTLTLKAEGSFEYNALLFIPDRPPYDLFYRDLKYGLQLYVNRVLIKESCDELLPDWLRFIKGVVDSPDLSLNVSREILQQDRRVAKIKERIIKKVLDHLAELQKNDRDRYQKFWERYGRVIKEGTVDFSQGKKLHDLLWFKSTNGDGFTSLAEYVSRMKEDQKEIFYITGESLAAVERSPHLEAFRDKGIEVLYLTDAVDEIMVNHLTEYDDKPLRSVGKGQVELGTEEEKKAAEENLKAQTEAHSSLLELIKSSLDEYVKEVRISNRLTTSACCLVGDNNDMSPGLERMLSQNPDAQIAHQKRILELNPDHPILSKMQQMFDVDQKDITLADYAHLLYGQACLAEGSPLPDPAKFTKLVADLMSK